MCINTCRTHLERAVLDEFNEYIVKQDLLPKEAGKSIVIQIDRAYDTVNKCQYCDIQYAFFVHWNFKGQ